MRRGSRIKRSETRKEENKEDNEENMNIRRKKNGMNDKQVPTTNGRTRNQSKGNCCCMNKKKKKKLKQNGMSTLKTY